MTPQPRPRQGLGHGKNSWAAGGTPNGAIAHDHLYKYINIHTHTQKRVLKKKKKKKTVIGGNGKAEKSFFFFFWYPTAGLENSGI